MMKKKSKAAVDGLLRDWASRQDFRADSLSELENKVMRNTRECLFEQNDGKQAAACWHFSMWRNLSLASVMVVAVVLVLVLPFSVQDRDIQRPDGANVQTVASFTPEQLAARKVVFDELNALFGGALRWVSVTERDFQFDFEADVVRPATPPVVLRTVILTRSEDGRAWEPVWNMDVILPADEYVTLEKPDAPIPQLGLWVHQLPDGGFVVQTDFGGAGTLADSRMQTFLPGDPDVQMTSLHSGDTEYRVTQSLAVIAGEAS